MTVKELIAQLKECDQDALVLCDLAHEGDWIPIEHVEPFDGVELRWPEGGQPEHYLRQGDSFAEEKWKVTQRKMVYISS